MKEIVNCRNATKDDANFIYNALLDMSVEINYRERFHMNESEFSECLFGEKKLAEVIIAELNSTPVGLILFSETNRNFAFFKKPGMYVHDIYVLPNYRRKKVACALADSVKSVGKERGYGRIDWVVLNDNKLGQDFFRYFSDVIKVDYLQYMRVNI